MVDENTVKGNTMLIEPPNPYSMKVITGTDSFRPILRIFNNEKYHDFDLEAMQDVFVLQDLTPDQYKAQVLAFILEALDMDSNFPDIASSLVFLKTYMLFLQEREKSQA
jgi:hypothetical protein